VGWLEVVAGILIVVASFYDLFKSVVLPVESTRDSVKARIADLEAQVSTADSMRPEADGHRDPADARRLKTIRS
jgi:hypothetical protein